MTGVLCAMATRRRPQFTSPAREPASALRGAPGGRRNRGGSTPEHVPSLRSPPCSMWHAPEATAGNGTGMGPRGSGVVGADQIRRLRQRQTDRPVTDRPSNAPAGRSHQKNDPCRPSWRRCAQPAGAPRTHRPSTAARWRSCRQAGGPQQRQHPNVRVAQGSRAGKQHRGHRQPTTSPGSRFPVVVPAPQERHDQRQWRCPGASDDTGRQRRPNRWPRPGALARQPGTPARGLPWPAPVSVRSTGRAGSTVPAAESAADARVGTGADGAGDDEVMPVQSVWTPRNRVWKPRLGA